MHSSKLFLFFIMVPSIAEAYRILLLLHMPGKSHAILGDAFADLLLDAGHEVTYITTVPRNKPRANLREIDISVNFQLIPDHSYNFTTILNSSRGIQFNVFLMIMHEFSKKTLKHKVVQELIWDPNEHFDLVICEWIFSDLQSGLSAVFGCPFIWFTAIDVHWMLVSSIDEATNPAYTPDCISPYVLPFTFIQRFYELWKQLTGWMMKVLILDNLEESAYKSLLVPAIIKRGREVPNYYDVKHNAAMVLANTHASLGQASRFPQNLKLVAGFHIKQELNALPEDIKQIMDNAIHGVIYFSLGSNVRSNDIPYKLKVKICEVFSRLKQVVIWKFEEDLTYKPKNVHTLKWAPQHSILSHPNCILFITHGGLMSFIEVLHFGVPMVGIPLYADQHMNVMRAVHFGLGKHIPLSYNIAEDLEGAIKEVLHNPKYKEKAKEISVIYHDRLVHPSKEIIHWVNHVVRTRGAVHLRSPALGVPWYQKYYLDVFILIIGFLVVFVLAIRRLCLILISKRENKFKSH